MWGMLEEIPEYRRSSCSARDRRGGDPNEQRRRDNGGRDRATCALPSSPSLRADNTRSTISFVQIGKGLSIAKSSQIVYYWHLGDFDSAQFIAVDETL